MPDAPRGLVRVETSAKRVRTYFGGHLVADTMHPLLVWEVPYFPSYFLPVDDIRAELVATGETKHSPSRGDADVYDVHAGDAVAKAAALRYATSPIEQIRNTVKIDWRSMDEWLEEDEPVYTHPRDPYTRVDILASSRHVRVEIDGVTVADSHGPRILFETGLPPRYYLPLSDCAMERFVRSGSETHCPYKGQASYWSVDVSGRRHDDVVWMYRSPFPESQKIAGLACFYNERVDLYIDDQLVERPHTQFS